MRVHVLTIILLVTTFFAMVCRGEEQINNNFDFSGIDAFWEIAAVLQRGEEPDDALWAELLESPAYVAMRVEFRDETHKKYFRAALSPDGEELRRQILDKYDKDGNTFMIWFSRSYLESLKFAAENPDIILAKAKELQTYPYVKEGVEALLPYLPEDSVDHYPPVCLIVFNDSRGGYGPLILSIGVLYNDGILPAAVSSCLAAKGYSDQRPQVLHFAHEFFHHYRNLKLPFELPEDEHDDYYLLWAINQIENEGIGDLINVRELYYDGGCLADSEKAQRIYGEQKAAPDELRGLNSMLEQVADDPQNIRTITRNIRNVISRSGHPAGFYMARIILAHEGRDSIASISRSPFEFFRHYNRIAQTREDIPRFSDKAMSVISDLEARYCRGDESLNQRSR